MSLALWSAAVLAGLAVLCLLPADRSARDLSAPVGAGRPSRRRSRAAVTSALRVLVLRRRSRDARARTGEQLREACRILAGEMRSGSTASAALALATEAAPCLEPAARAAALGADVPQALRESGEQAPQLRWLAAAWQVSADTGAGLADAMDRMGVQLDRARATRRVVASELASARATARLLVALPLAALVLGSGAGTDPWAFLFGTSAGALCLVLGVALEIAGLWWIESIAASVERQT